MNRYALPLLLMGFYFLPMFLLRAIANPVDPEAPQPQGMSAETDSEDELSPAFEDTSPSVSPVAQSVRTDSDDDADLVNCIQKLKNILTFTPFSFEDDGRNPAVFRNAVEFAPPNGLHPPKLRTGLFEIYPWFGLTESFDSNVNLTVSNPIRAFYITPHMGVDFQLGTPDATETGELDTMTALAGSYAVWADIFYGNPGLSAFNQNVQLLGRIGRTCAIWRPYFSYSDITGSNILQAELVNRTRRLQTAVGTSGQYQFTGQLGANQTFDYHQLEHSDQGYINCIVAKTLQEVTWRLRNQLEGTAWGEYRYTDPSSGDSASEVIGGLGFYGQPDPRVYSELRIGWDFITLDGSVPERKNMSGIRFNGRTTVDWSERLRLTLLYGRGYEFSETVINNKYVSTLVQGRAELFLGGNWYLTPYFGCSVQEYETTGPSTMQLRPEIELAYALPGSFSQPGSPHPSDSRVFLKAGAMNSAPLNASGQTTRDLRLSFGVTCRF